MPNDNQGNYPGEGHYYNQGPQTGGPPTQNFGTGPQGGKLPSQPPKRPKAMTIVVLVLVALVIILGATAFLALRHTSAPPITTGPTATPQQSSKAGTTPVPTVTSPTGSTPASSPGATAQPVATVVSGIITENLLLTCGANCDDPIQVTITTIQVDDANGRMIWNISLKNVTGNSVYYGINTFELLANGAQNQVLATFSQSQGTLTNTDPYSIQGIFAFVPVENTTYTLTAVVSDVNGGVTINFDPVQITNL